ncbi:MAG: translation initiation factor IF-2 subunit beta [archaeon]
MRYEELLDKAFKELPEKATKAERFEPPVISSFLQGKQTILKNISEVADKLRREPEHIMRFMSRELAAPASFDGKKGIIQGNFKEDLLNSRLKKYIDEYVLCGQCKKPDTSIITMENVKHKRCEVCGARSPVKTV